ncbi:MAG: S-methyl-5-thioribose-1-phosphate isomerase, partial [Rubrivivax sp.]|nr:S-methyl-5-thioribose-1-phosphate isomerase [Rubrivivax sp.]
MNVHDQAMRPLRAEAGRDAVVVIDQRLLPHRLQLQRLASPQAVFTAIRDMWVRGAPLIGATAAYGMALQCHVDVSDGALAETAALLRSSRPTAVNLMWALDRMARVLAPLP